MTILCCIGKLENNYIREFVEYHKGIGFDNICLCDNNDVDGERFEDVIGDYIESGYVLLRDYRGRQKAQIQAYTDCYSEFDEKYDWIAFIDIDEFIEIEDGRSIGDFLADSRFSKANCIRLCWKQYTDSGLIKVEDGNYSVKRFTEVLDNKLVRNGSSIKRSDVISNNCQTKSIFRTKNLKGIKMSSPHGCWTDKRIVSVDALGRNCRNSISIGSNVVWKGAWINHYRCKTIEEFVLGKMVRLWPTGYGNGGKTMLNLDFFFHMNIKTDEKVKYAEKLIKEHSINRNEDTKKKPLSGIATNRK